MLKVCSCCLRSRAKTLYSPENWASAKIRRCNECAASNRQIQNPNIQGTFPLPKAGKGTRVFASKDVANDIIPDSHGNLHLVLGGGKDVRNMCANCGKGASDVCKMQACARCKKSKYCSRECQVSDWKRHKREECIKKSGAKVQLLGKIDTDDQKISEAHNKMCEGMEKLCVEGTKKLPTYPGGVIGDVLMPPEDMNELIKNFTLRFYLQLAPVAAWHIKRYPQLKGALFVFSKVSFFDLTNVPRDIGTNITDTELDRTFAVAWGHQPADGVAQRTPFTWLDLAGKFLHNTKSLPWHMENCCDQESFTIVMCCDPGGDMLPDMFNEHLRLPKNVDPGCYMDEVPGISQVLRMRFLGFDSMLEFANEPGGPAECEVKMLNVDRDQSNPNVN